MPTNRKSLFWATLLFLVLFPKWGVAYDNNLIAPGRPWHLDPGLDTVNVQGSLSPSPNLSGSGSGAGATVSTVQTLTAPLGAVGFILMNLDVSTTNMRWAVGRTASTTTGQQLQPGRSSDFVPVGADVSIIAESGTVTYDIQWISQ